MKLEFLGTRGYIEPRNRRHRMHSALMVSYYGKRVLIDCGEDWLGELEALNPHAIVVTHAHPDHAWGLKEGAPCPVYATEISWEKEMESYDIEEREVMPAREPVEIAGITFEAFPVDHSTRAPAVGYRVIAGEVTIFYVPDVVWIRDREAALSGAKVYVGDGATITRSMVRKIDDNLIGHVPIRTQLTWCQKEGVPRAIFTHVGSEIVKGDERSLGPKVQELAEERGVEAQIAHDGMEEVLR
ncbi:MAG: MBL fold metallo-hydrolase [Anaerolineae bacterium]